MSTRLYGILTDGLNKPIVNATVALLAKGNTITVLNGSEAVFRTDGEGAYNVTVQAGHYKVIIGPQGIEPYKAGEIIIYSDSPEGSLNGYLINWAPEELTPDVIKQVQQLVANSEGYALQAERSAAAANADATDARNSKASAAQSASDALVYKNDAKASEDAAKQAQAGAAGSANTASQAVTTIQGLKSDVEQLKADTQGIKDSSVSETTVIKDAAVSETTALKDAAAASAAQASNSATEAGQQATNAAGSAQSASTDAGRAELAAGKAEQVISQALLKDNNLSDVSDLDITRSNLKVDKLVQETEHTFLYTDDKRYRLSIGSGEIVFQHDTDGQNNWTTVPFPVDIGGTGASTASEARTNLDVPANNEALLVENNLQDLADRAAAWLNVRPQGSTPLAGDPVNDYDATTKRWVLNIISTGTVGPTMNGVMNYGVGDFHLRDSRAYIQPYEVVSDGQLLNRADWPELWAYAQMTSPIEDADWLANPANRGKYSIGDGETTFRVPDRNGVQTGSISGLYARGDGGNSTNDGTVQQNAAPDITGTVGANIWSVYGNPTGAMYNGTPLANIPLGAATTPAHFVGFRAGLSNAAYGRDNTTEVRTNSFMGVWVIRASGGFVAANTSWSVINGDAASPAIGTTVKGGKVRSVYKVGASEYGVAELQSSVSTDGTGVRTVGAEVVVTDATSGIATSKTIKLGTVDGLTGGEIGSIITVRGAGLQPKLVASHLDYNPALGGNAIWIVGMTGTENIMQYATEVTGQYYSLTTVFRVAGQQQFWSQTSTGRYLTPLGELAIQGSDVRIKKDFTPPKEGAWDRVKSIGICEFKYKGQNVTKRGFLAQQMGEIDPVYTFEGGTAHDDDGNEFEILNVNDKAVLADVITVMQMMQDKIEAMETEIAELKASK